MSNETTSGRIRGLDIVIHALGMPFNGDTIKQQSLGGSESAAYYQARELAARGHRVQLWTGHEQGGVFDGVTYTHVGQVTQEHPLGATFGFYATKTPHDVLIIQRHPMAFHKDYASKVNIWQMHDVALHRTHGMAQGGLPRVDFTTTVSDWHGHQVGEVYGIGEEAIRTVPNGVDPALYGGPYLPHPVVEGLKAEGKFICLYQSRPERGLELLLKPDGIMAKLAAAGSKAHLLVCGYDNTQPQMAAYYGQLQAWGEQLPNVTYLGSLTKPELARLQRGCDLMLYPTSFAEVSCITAMEAMHAGLPMLTSKYAALAETCRHTGTVLVDLKGNVPSVALDNLIAGIAQQEVDEGAFVAKVQWLEGHPLELDQLRAKQLKAAANFTWARAVDRLEAVIEEAFARRRNPTRMLRHLIEHSDIMAANTYWKNEELVNVGGKGDIAQAAMNELDSMYAFARLDGDPEALRKHYEYWEGLNCDRLASQGQDIAAEIERFTQTTRFRGMLQFVARGIQEARARVQLEALQAAQATEVVYDDVDQATVRQLREDLAPVEPRRVRVLEFGCAHGHVILPLAKIFPDVDFVGVDFMAKSIGMAFESAKQLGIGNVTFSQRDQSQLGDDLGQFDVVLAAEVLEHVWDYEATLYALRKRLIVGSDPVSYEGAIVTTTPCGRWEWSGRDNWRKGREHLHHFEAADLMDVFGPWGLNRDGDMLYAPTDGHDGTGGQMGSWLCYVQPKVALLGAIDYERKFKYLAPRETLSLCMIVKDGENTLRKCLGHVLPWVDQVVLGIDRTTTDGTREIVAKLQLDYPQVPITVLNIESPLETGFAAARNATLDAAEGDWILWMDADEELPYAFNAWRLLRPSAFNAYACPQIHYAVMPAQVLTTDFPCRLFRHNRGTRFHGLVHEHPEDTQGKAISHTMMTGDLQFLHGGYVDENVRRARYQRNLPLLLRDIEANPDRSINKFLLLRDISQGIAFEQQMTGGIGVDAQARARKGVELFNELLKQRYSLRMQLDAVPYYSVCVEALGTFGSFDGEVTLGVARVGTPSMAAQSQVKGRFEDRDTYLKLAQFIIEESTKHYDSKYA